MKSGMQSIDERRRENLRALIDEVGGNKALADRIGVSESQLSQWANGSINSSTGKPRGMRTETAQRIEDAAGKPRGWLDGIHLSAHATAYASSTAELTTGGGKEAIPLEGNPAYPAVRRVRFRLSAGASGFGVDYVDEDAEPIVFRRDWFESRGYSPDKLFAVRVANGSMEPGLWAGDTVVVNTADVEPLLDGQVYAVNFEGELIIKRLVRDEGRWWLKSDNPDQTRYPRKVCDDRVFILGRVVHKQSEHL
jgi:phage repressor protein C with HTH and peptisase S24 domain